MAEGIPSNQGASEEATEEEPSTGSLGAMGAPWHHWRQQRQSRVERRQRLESKGELLLLEFAYQIFNLALLYLSELLDLSMTTSC